MAKKSNKTAHVLSLLSNGQGSLLDDATTPEAVEAEAKATADTEVEVVETEAPPAPKRTRKKKVVVEPVVETVIEETVVVQPAVSAPTPVVAQTAPTQAEAGLHPQTVYIPTPAPAFSKTTQMAQFANYESQIMTQNEISSIPNLMHAMPAMPAQKPEIVVQMQTSHESNALSDLVKADLEKALEKQIQARFEADAHLHNYEEGERPPYSATFLSKFGDNLKQMQDARTKASQPSDQALDLSQEVRHALEESLAHEYHIAPEPAPVVGDEAEPTLETVKKEDYVWENFDDEDDDQDSAENNVSNSAANVGYNTIGAIAREDIMGNEYTAVNSPNLRDAEDAKKVVIRNLAEELVKAKAPEIMESMNMCTCPACVLDVVALTLNHIQPLYISTEKGELFSKISAYDLQNSTDVTSEITKACIKIKLNPRHPAKA